MAAASRSTRSRGDIDFNGAVGAATIDSGAGADSFNFAAAVGAASIDAGVGADTLTFADVVSNATLVVLMTPVMTASFSGSVLSGVQQCGHRCAGELR